MPRRAIEQHGDARLNRIYAKSPLDLLTARTAFQNRLESGQLRAMSFGVDTIDHVVRTIWPGTLTTIIARPSNFKTSLMVHLARTEAARLVAEGVDKASAAADRRYVLFATLEEDEVVISQSITRGPSVTAMLDGAYRPDDLRRNNESVLSVPVWTVGYERRELADDIEDMPALTVEQLYREVVQIEKDGHGRPSLILVDYLQILEVEGRPGQKNEQVSAALQTLKKMSRFFGCPIVLAVQAKESVDKNSPPIPQVGDSYYSSEVAHYSDVMMSLYYPFRYGDEVHGGYLNWKGTNYPVDPTKLCLQLLKQRKGHGREFWMLDIDPSGQEILGITGALRPRTIPHHYSDGPNDEWES
jgi:replicative DNA helicase